MPSKVAGADGSAAMALSDAETRYIGRNPASKAQHEIAVNSLPGGNTRTLLHTNPFPLVVKKGEGTVVWDVDGHRYTDFVGELTAGIYGHSHPVIREAIISTFDKVGMSLGSTSTQEQKYAALICERFSLDRVRFTNSGTEANIHAINGARAFTGRSKIIVFSGGYHGAVLAFKDTTVAPNNVWRDDWVIGRYNDVEGARALIEDTPDLAAVLVEAMQGSGGCIPGTREFLHQAQASARAAGAVFVLDEVMTSRLAPAGLQSVLGLAPDLTTLGKYLGGGFSFGAFGGRADVMAVYDPRARGALSHSGTFNNNTMTMHAGRAGLEQIFTPGACARLAAAGDELRARLQAASKGTKLSWTGVGSLMAAHFSDSGVVDVKCVEDVVERSDLTKLFWYEMLEEGFSIVSRGMICLILDTPKAELDRFVGCVEKFLGRHKSILEL